MQLSIVLVTGGLVFNGNTDREKALGGSETALINVARELAKAGHYVRVFCNCDKEDVYDGVFYYDAAKSFKSFISHGECDICIVSRYHQFLAEHKINSKLNILWNHDILTDPSPLIASLWQYDYMYTLSDYHRKQYVNLIPELDGQMMKHIPNGIDMSLVPPHVASKDKLHRIMFTSRPERGLYQALQMYEQYNDKELELLICNYATVNDPAVAEIEKVCFAKIQELINKGFKITVDRFVKDQLYAEISMSKAVLYPTRFPEIFCISAIEALACGTVYITTDDFALPEVVPYDKCNFVDDGNIEYMNMLMKVMRDDKYRESLENQGKEFVANYSWENVAKQFVSDAMDYFKVRSKDQKGIIERMVYESDIVNSRDTIGNMPVVESPGELRYGLYKKLNHDLRFAEGKEDYKSIYEKEEHHETCGFDALARVPRIQWPATQVRENDIRSILSYGCHNGVSEILISNNNPDCKVVGYDISENIIKEANKMKKENAKYKDNVSFISQLPKDAAWQQFDAVYIGEVLEHVLEPEKLVEELEQYVKPGGKVFITLPRGAWEHLSHENNIKNDTVFHVHCFDWWDIQTMFNQKPDFDLVSYHDGNAQGYYQECIGNYLISYTKDENIKVKNREIARKLLLSRPYQSISACIIARDADNTIEKLLDSITFEMDEIIIGVDHEAGECDEFIKRIEKYPKVKWFYLSKRIVSDKLGFAAARNETVAKASSKWIFWIDTDEELLKREKFRKYLDTPYFNSFNVLQQHPQLDSFLEADKPQRLFRKGAGEFVGFIHEQVQDINDINKGLDPSVILSDCHVLNFGELHEGMRRNKAMGRNLDLLEVDVKENVDKRLKQGKTIRYMSIILLMRDFINRIVYSIEEFGTVNNRDAQEFSLPQIKSLYDKFFKSMPDEKDNYYKNLAYKMLQDAMALAGDGTPIEVKIGDKTLTRRLNKSNLEKLEQLLKVI